MKDICIVPAWERPEFLWLSLEHIFRCPEVNDIDVKVYLDRAGLSRSRWDVRRICADFKVELIERDPHHGYYGNSFNVLSAYAEAAYARRAFIFMVEEDVLVTPDFFEWHYDIQDRVNPFVSVGARKTGGEYRSLGVCFDAEHMHHVAAHAVPKYFANMLAYCSRVFPNSNVPIQQTEQDGLIRRVMEINTKWMPVFPDTPVAYHVGYVGYNRPRLMTELCDLSLVDRVAQLRNVVYNQTMLSAMSAPSTDCEAYPYAH